jgi:GTP-binding protein HflX
MKEQKYIYSEELRTDKAILMGVILPKSPCSYLGPLAELQKLAETAGMQVVAHVTQQRQLPHSVTYIGKGKLEEVKQMADELGANVIISDDDLSPSQAKKLNKIFGRRVIDRTELILEIFAAHARTHEAKMQVELAQLQYALPRLTRLWVHLDRYTGKIGARGPGEMQLESDKRILKHRIYQLTDALKTLQNHKEREVYARREKFLTVAIVGYTNAGKSTLMNSLTDASVLVEDKLFSTLDTRTRMWQLPGRTVLLSDTVGFIEKLPHHLVASFKATLEEALQADLLLHVVDASHPDAKQQIEVVHNVLESIHLHEKPLLLVLNKVDAVSDYAELSYLANLYPRHVAISAKLGQHFDELAQKTMESLEADMLDVRVSLPVTNGKLISWLEDHCRMVEKSCVGEEMHYLVRLSKPRHAWLLEQEGVKEL